MNDNNHTFWRTPRGWAALFLMSVTIYFLLTEHLQHVFQFLSFLILLMRPLMHFFMHNGYGYGYMQMMDMMMEHMKQQQKMMDMSE